ncbi:hypothetical protein GCM10011374_16360 [Kocuria dechangensis]|uniref:Glyoxalase/fosfomycin resistance/dioxygenase domain-containing protein n=1 Tax=Kocuria dechangensis TaxID=1176249 RepID=A0A917GQA1_9MICC|nr:hypothetical protein GCM10011374_16360 [Kocuria dechangensis]
MTIALQYCHLTVTDVEESIAFYVDALGLTVLNDVSAGGFRWVTLGTDVQPGLGIVLSVPHAGRSQADGDALQELLTKGVLPMIVFAADDLEATFRTVRVRGRGPPGAHRPALGPARLRVPRPLGQHRPDRPGARGLTPWWAAPGGARHGSQGTLPGKSPVAGGDHRGRTCAGVGGGMAPAPARGRLVTGASRPATPPGGRSAGHGGNAATSPHLDSTG